MSDDRVLQLRGLVRRFRSGASQLLVLDEVDLEVRAGEMVGLVGPSGSGKSSLLHAAGLLEEPTAGEVRLADLSGWTLDDSGRTALRRNNIGFVYQFHHLLPEFTALENAALPALIAGRPSAEANGEARRLLAALGLEGRLDHRPSQLSGGEQQRVAIARALVNKPLLVLADEPTGNLDPDTANAVFDALAQLVRAEGTAAIVATHNYELARFMDRVVGLSHGKLVELDPCQPIEPQLASAPRTASPSLLPEQQTPVRPWARFWAKQVDVTLHATLIGLVLFGAGAVFGEAFRAGLVSIAPVIWLAIMLSYPLTDALLVSRTGGSIGRALFRFSVRTRTGQRPSFGTALARAWTCLFFGQGIGLPVIWLFTVWASYSNLIQYRASLWDRDAGTEVVHRGPAWWSWLTPTVFFGVLAAGAWYWGQVLVGRLGSMWTG